MGLLEVDHDVEAIDEDVLPQDREHLFGRDGDLSHDQLQLACCERLSGVGSRCAIRPPENFRRGGMRSLWVLRGA